MDRAAVRANQATVFSIRMVVFLAVVGIFLQPVAAVVALACLAFITGVYLRLENTLMGRLVDMPPDQLEAIWYYYDAPPENGGADDSGGDTAALQPVNDPVKA